MFTGRRLSGFGSGHATPRSRRQAPERGTLMATVLAAPPPAPESVAPSAAVTLHFTNCGQPANQPPSMLCLLCSARMAAYLGSKLGRVARLLSGDGDDFAASTPNSLNSPGGPLAGAAVAAWEVGLHSGAARVCTGSKAACMALAPSCVSRQPPHPCTQHCALVCGCRWEHSPGPRRQHRSLPQPHSRPLFLCRRVPGPGSGR